MHTQSFSTAGAVSAIQCQQLVDDSLKRAALQTRSMVRSRRSIAYRTQRPTVLLMALRTEWTVLLRLLLVSYCDVDDYGCVNPKHQKQMWLQTMPRRRVTRLNVQTIAACDVVHVRQYPLDCH